MEKLWVMIATQQVQPVRLGATIANYIDDF